LKAFEKSTATTTATATTATTTTARATATTATATTATTEEAEEEEGDDGVCVRGKVGSECDVLMRESLQWRSLLINAIVKGDVKLAMQIIQVQTLTLTLTHTHIHPVHALITNNIL